MTSGIEALGDAMTGAVIASAVEPGQGEAGHNDSDKCLNCGTRLMGHYCHACGQNGHVHRSLTGFGHDLLHGVFHFEGKFWATLPMLLLKPGELTRRYIHGERAKFVSPVAMFLFCVFLMFAVVGGLAGSMHIPDANDIPAAQKNKSITELRAALAKNDAQVKVLRAQKKADEKAGKDTAAIDAKIDAIESDNGKIRAAQSFVTGGKEGRRFGQAFNLETGWPALDHGLAAVNQNPNLFLYQLQTKAYKYSWLLIPISTPMVWLLFFWKREYKFYDHLIFVTFSLIFMSLLVTVATIIGWIGLDAGWLVFALLLIPPFHIYKQLRGAYLCSRFGAIVRTWILVWFAFTALLLFTMALLAMGLMH